MVVVGFTGTRRIDKVVDARFDNLAKVIHMLGNAGVEWLHHGMADGADVLANDYAQRVGIRTCGWPAKRRSCVVDIEHPPMDPLARNRKIVAAADLLVAMPVDPGVEERRSGTWATIRYARAKGIPILLV